MKRTVVLWLALLLLSACQPTPETDAVKQKNTNQLIESVKTAEKEKPDAPDAVPAATQFPARFTMDEYTEGRNVHIVADVPLRVLTDGTFPLLRVEHRFLTDAERLTLGRRILKSEQLYVWEEHPTRKDLETQIADLMREITPEEKKEWMEDTDSTEEDFQELLERRQAELTRLQAQYNALSADDAPIPLAPWDGAVPAYSRDHSTPNEVRIVSSPVSVSLGTQSHVMFYANEMDCPAEYSCPITGPDDITSVWFFDPQLGRKEGTERILQGDYDAVHVGATVSAMDAMQTALSYFEGIADLAVTDVYWTSNAPTDGPTAGRASRWAYLVEMTGRYGGAFQPYCETPMFDSSADGSYARTWYYESVRAAIAPDGSLISLCWVSPLRVTDTVSESVALLPYEQITDIFRQQTARVLATEENTDATLTVDDVQLGLFRIREQNSMDSGLLVPAWFFTGHLAYAKPYQKDYRNDRYFDALNPLLIVNAIDGSIIDSDKGY